MQLPRSIIQSLLARTIHFLTIGMTILLLAMVSVDASATTSQLAFTPSALRFGGIVVGQSETLLVTVTNTGQTSVTVSGIAVGNSEFTTSSVSLPLVLSAGQSVDLSVTFAPKTMGWTGSTIRFFSNASNANLNVGGTGESAEALTASPSIVSFGQVAMGTTSTVPVVLTNARSWQVTLFSLQTSGSGFSISGPAVPLTLGVGQSVTLKVAFAPQSAGTVGGSLLISGPALAIPLTGTGTAPTAHTTPGQIAANPGSLAFGSAQVGSSVTMADSITNTGGSSVTISQATATGTGFSISGLNVPVVLNPGASVPFSAVFAPQSAASVSGGITLVSNASNSTLNVSLSGTGMAPAQAPVITSATTASGTAGTAFSYQIAATNTPTSYGATGLPAGLSVNSGNGLISGTPPTAATSTVTLSASNSGGTANATLTLTIKPAVPVITSATTASGTAGSAFSYQIAASNTPSSYGATGLPAGLSVNGTSGLISGTPTAAATSTVTLSANNSGGTGSASLTLTINPAPAAGQLTANPASLAFGSAQVGSSLTLTDSLTNTGGSSVTISQATATGTGFSISGLTVPLTLNPGASVTFSALFAPQSAASLSGGIAVVSNASNSTLNVSLSGTGTAPGTLTIAPTTLSFGNATVGTSVSQSSSLSAAGASVTVSSASLSSAEFSLTGISLPVTITAGQSVPVTMTFTPQSSGSASGVLTVGSNASNAATQTLSGMGVAPTQHSVSLSWTDTNSGTAGYNVYRGNASGGPFTEINSGLDTTTAYSDTSVTAGQTYYYVATAVNESGEESAYSNEAQAAVPSN
jgi:putative Ig domain-containing protein/ASPM-SPD-2-Hydin domain-containing protein/centrosomal CEP192-like protein